MARITFEGKRYPLEDGEDALRALLRGGAAVPFSCRKGTCHTCMLRAVEGDPGPEARAGLREPLTATGHFLPCKAMPEEDLVVERPDSSQLFVRMHVQEKEMVAPDVARIALEPETQLDWLPGQYVDVRHPDGTLRSYSIATVPLEDPYVEIHVKRLPGGKVSGWLVDEVEVGAVLDVQGPLGDCVLPAGVDDRPLILMGVGTGLAPLLGLARQALATERRGELFLYHGARDSRGLYRHAELLELARRHPRFTYVPCVTRGELPEGVTAGRVLAVAARRHPDLTGFVAFLCGLPAMVDEARIWAFRAGAAREDIHADPYDLAVPSAPDDGAKLRTIQPDPELWEALGRGSLLRTILTDFYERVYADPRLSPFFHKVTIERAVDKQYEFLADLFTGDRRYFGLKPFNAHHWMVISEELFDYRERLIEGVMRRHGLADHLVRRWCTIHEMFRRAIVKSKARGLVVDGVERPAEQITEEIVEVATVCDGCSSEMAEGSRGRLNSRTGELFCSSCAARRVGMTLPPLALATP